jgi:hypothetical protein
MSQAVCFLVMIWWGTATCATGTVLHASDTANGTPARWTFTPRFNTLNMAPVSGNIVNSHVNLDLSLAYTNNRFTWMVANGVDLEDFRSEMNYLLTNVRYKVNLTGSLSVSPFLAFYSEHTQQLIDPISDFNGGMILSLQKGAFTFEAFALLVRLTHEAAQKDLINRFEVRYKGSSTLFSGFVFQNTAILDGRRRLALGFRATLPEFELWRSSKARAEVTGSFKLTEYPETKNLSGVFLSLAFPFKR